MIIVMASREEKDIDHVVHLTKRIPASHGGPVHVGNPDQLGIRDLSSPDFGDAVPLTADDVPVFWACGVTAQAVARASQIPLMITHAPGHMLITDARVESLAASDSGDS